MDSFKCNGMVAVKAATWEVNNSVTEEDFAEEFKKRPHQAKRDYASIPSHAVEGFFKDPELLTRRVCVEARHPLDELNRFESWFVGDPRFSYYVHYDLAIRRDALGVAMAHYDYNIDKVIVDFMLQIKAPEDANIDFESARQLVYRLDERGFNIAQVSYDAWQSQDSIQTLSKKGFKAVMLGFDVSMEAYDTLLELILADRLVYYNYPVFIKECQELRIIHGRRVDHPSKGSKDVSDAVSHCVHQALLNAGGRSSWASSVNPFKDRRRQSRHPQSSLWYGSDKSYNTTIDRVRRFKG